MKRPRVGAKRSMSALDRPAVEVAVAHGSGVIHLVAVARDSGDLDRQLAAYVSEQSRYQLARGEEEAVRLLLHLGRWDAAVERYFSSRDGRWGPEELFRARIPLPGRGAPTPVV